MTPIVSVTPWRAHMMDTHATAIAAIAANGRRRSVDESNRSRLGVGDRAPVSSLSTSARGVAPYVGLVRRMKAMVYGRWRRAVPSAAVLGRLARVPHPSRMLAESLRATTTRSG